MKAYIINLRGKKISKTVTTPEGIKKLKKAIRLRGQRINSNVLVIKN